jgi:HAD superfamily hydrolase (TIGR01509 family)
MLNYVIFDMDGVLIDSEPTHARAAVNAVSHYGVTIDIPYCYQFIGSTTRFMMETILSDFHIDASAEELLAAVEAEKVRLTKEEGYTEIPGVCDLVADLHRHGVKLAVASSSNPEEIRQAVDALKLTPYFDKLVSGCTVANPKPAPDVFLKAVEELHADKEECLIIEDSCNGILAAKAAQIPAIGFANPHSGKQDLSSAYMVIEGFEEIDYAFLSKEYQHAHNLPVTITATKRTIIRELTEHDIKELYQIYQNEEVTKYTDKLDDSLEIETEKQKAYIQTVYHFYGYGIWGIFDTASGKLIGRCGIESKLIDAQPEFELSYLLDRTYWGKGYALECTSAVIRYAQNHLNADRITAVIDKENIRSIRLAERLGFLAEKSLLYQNRSCYLYALTLSNKKRKAGAIVKNKYSRHPDTSVYGKRYSPKDSF